ncbi:hypothetical protein SO694_0000100 [Aureococcus anophagefferens]|uniref:Tetrahydrofolate dehydrogenase/cyclohydrolase catalytic domain-containing protein n=1 Tax=Aureococcus anophagefferens TaxID=44056 RepID=A0ABR1GAR9_AURAN
MRQSDGWTRTTIILKPPSGDDRSSARVIAQGLAEKDARLAALAPKIRKGDVVALGISQSERDGGRRLLPRQGRRATGARGQPTPGQRRARRLEHQEGRVLLDRALVRPEAVRLLRGLRVPGRAAPRDGHRGRRRRALRCSSPPLGRAGRAGAPAQFQLAKASEAAIHNENLDKYVDRAAAGSSA